MQKTAAEKKQKWEVKTFEDQKAEIESRKLGQLGPSKNCRLKRQKRFNIFDRFAETAKKSEIASFKMAFELIWSKRRKKLNDFHESTARNHQIGQTVKNREPHLLFDSTKRRGWPKWCFAFEPRKSRALR